MGELSWITCRRVECQGTVEPLRRGTRRKEKKSLCPFVSSYPPYLMRSSCRGSSRHARRSIVWQGFFPRCKKEVKHLLVFAEAGSCDLPSGLWWSSLCFGHVLLLLLLLKFLLRLLVQHLRLFYFFSRQWSRVALLIDCDETNDRALELKRI